jgi:hypothetical protein
VKTYLSIDLDFWNGLGWRSIEGFFKHVFDLRLPIFVAPFHDQLLPHINQHPCNTLINVDYHSDIADDDGSLICEEGTWANFVEWKHDGTFIWRYSDSICPTPNEGYCHDRINPFKHPCVSGWGRCRKRQGWSAIPWHTIKAIGVCLSIYWIEKWRNPFAPIAETLGMREWLMMDSTEQRLGAKPFLRRAK